MTVSISGDVAIVGACRKDGKLKGAEFDSALKKGSGEICFLSTQAYFYYERGVHQREGNHLSDSGC